MLIIFLHTVYIFYRVGVEKSGKAQNRGILSMLTLKNFNRASLKIRKRQLK